MLFNSLSFAIFFPIVFILYWGLPHRYRWVLILAASYYFYMSWNVKYVILILFTTCASYVAGILLEKQSSKRKKQIILTITAVLCLGILFFFKYFNFVSDSIVKVLSHFAIQINPITLNLLLPVGISFYTFQTLSYVIDVYRGDLPAEKHFGYYAAFISFFPQLVAGPIERTRNLLPQIKAEHFFNYEKAEYGARLMIWGFFKKLVIADVLLVYVSKVYDDPTQFSGFSLILATLFFTFQIYCDFSGYSDIAIGAAKLLDIDLMINFKSPYFSASIKEFWSRWHISLSTWFRDYVYIPLGGNRVSKIRHNANLIITFLVSGLWHGANWTFVIWGGIHGIGQVIENAIIKKKKKIVGVERILRVFVVFVFAAFAWIFFVSNSLGDACYVINHMFDGINNPISYIYSGFVNIGLGKFELIKIVMSLIVLSVFDFFNIKTDCIAWIGGRNAIVKHATITLFLIALLCFSHTGQSTFVYFQF